MFSFKNWLDEYHTYTYGTAKDAFKRAYQKLRYQSRFLYPCEFTHIDMPELGITLARLTIPENESIDGKIHTTTVIERTVF